MQFVVENLAEVVRKAFSRALEAHRRWGEHGKSIMREQQTETRLRLIARLAVLVGVAKWCQMPGRFVKVVTSTGVREFGDRGAVFYYHLWFSGLLGQDAYIASTADNPASGGYGMTFAIGQGAEPTLSDILWAGMLRLDTGEWLERNRIGGLWHTLPDSSAATIPLRHSGLQADHAVLAERQFHAPLADFNPHDTGGVFSNAYCTLVGTPFAIGDTNKYPVAAVGAFDMALPALYHLNKVGGGVLYLPVEHPDRLSAKTAIERFGQKPQVMGTDVSTAWEIARVLQ